MKSPIIERCLISRVTRQILSAYSTVNFDNDVYSSRFQSTVFASSVESLIIHAEKHKLHS